MASILYCKAFLAIYLCFYTESFYLCSYFCKSLGVCFMEIFGRSGAVESIYHYTLGSDLFDQLQPRRYLFVGGQQARFQVLLLELSGATMLLLDEPTDNLDLVSAEALQQALKAFEGTVLAVTHDRWFTRDFDRFLIFGSDGEVYESDEAVWDETRVTRERT